MRLRAIAISALLCACACACGSTPARAPVVQPKRPAPTVAKYPEAPTPHLTPQLVLATIRDRYLSGVERCYARHAKRLGSASGRVLVSFTVDEDGTTRDGNARGITKRVDGCIKAQVARWTFPAPRKESSFALGLQLSTE